jgi:hypothetical protein
MAKGFEEGMLGALAPPWCLGIGRASWGFLWKLSRRASCEAAQLDDDDGFKQGVGMGMKHAPLVAKKPAHILYICVSSRHSAPHELVDAVSGQVIQAEIREIQAPQFTIMPCGCVSVKK